MWAVKFVGVLRSTRDPDPVPDRAERNADKSSRRERRDSKRERRGRDGSSRRRSRKSRGGKPRPLQEEHKKRTKSLMLLQQDLFVMTTTTVFRNLEEDDYPITQSLKDGFNPKEMYEKALANDVPWRQWQNWIHEQIIQKMIEQGSIPPKESKPGGTQPRNPEVTPGRPASLSNAEAGPGGKNKEDCVIS